MRAPTPRGPGAAVSSAPWRWARCTRSTCELSAAEAAELARDPAVVAIEPDAEPGLADERAAQIVAGNLSGFAQPSGARLPRLADRSRSHPRRRELRLRDRRDRRRPRQRSRPARPLGLPRARLAANPDRVVYRQNYIERRRHRRGRGLRRPRHQRRLDRHRLQRRRRRPAIEDFANGFNHGLGVAPFARVGASKIFNCAGGFAGGWTPADAAVQRLRRRRAHLEQLVGHERSGLLGLYSTRAQQYDAAGARRAQSDAGQPELRRRSSPPATTATATPTAAAARPQRGLRLDHAPRPRRRT